MPKRSNSRFIFSSRLYVTLNGNHRKSALEDIVDLKQNTKGEGHHPIRVEAQLDYSLTLHNCTDFQLHTMEGFLLSTYREVCNTKKHRTRVALVLHFLGIAKRLFQIKLT